MKFSLGLHILIGFQAIAAASSPLFTRDVAGIERDLALVSSNLTNFDSALHAFVQSGALIQALTVHSDTPLTTTSLSQTTTDIQATGAISATDASAIEQTLVSIESIVEDICLTFRNSVATSTTLPTGGVRALIQQDVTAIVTAFNSLLTAAQGVSPSPLSSQLAALKVQVDSACNLNGGPIVP